MASDPENDKEMKQLAQSDLEDALEKLKELEDDVSLDIHLHFALLLLSLILRIDSFLFPEHMSSLNPGALWLMWGPKFGYKTYLRGKSLGCVSLGLAHTNT